MKTLFLLLATLSAAAMVLSSAPLHGTSPLELSIETAVCRTIPHDNPIDLARDTKLSEAREAMGELLSTGVVPTPAQIETMLQQHFSQVTSSSSGMVYYWLYDEVDEEWYELCVEKTTFEIDGQTDTNPILVEFSCSERAPA